MDKFVIKLREMFSDTGKSRMKDVEKILIEQTPKDTNPRKTTVANNGPCDTVEENLKRIESNRNMYD